MNGHRPADPRAARRLVSLPVAWAQLMAAARAGGRTPRRLLDAAATPEVRTILGELFRETSGDYPLRPAILRRCAAWLKSEHDATLDQVISAEVAAARQRARQRTTHPPGNPAPRRPATSGWRLRHRLRHLPA